MLPVVAIVGVLATAARGGEADYEIVSQFPPVTGELTGTLEGDDRQSGLHLVRKTYTVVDTRADIVTHVAEARCANRPAAEATPFLVAIQLKPKSLRSFAEATLFDVFVEVYVRDRDGRVRLYRDITGRAMSELTDRLQPACVGI